jgi:putative membrane protein
MNDRYALPELPYDYAALEPHYSARALELHHGEHHAAYVAGANATLEKLCLCRVSPSLRPSPVDGERVRAAGAVDGLLRQILGEGLTNTDWPSARLLDSVRGVMRQRGPLVETVAPPAPSWLRTATACIIKDRLMASRDDRVAFALLGVVLAALVVAGIAPHDGGVFVLEVVPWVVLLAIAVATHRRFPLTPISHVASAGLCLLLVVGAHYTYTRVPAGLWLRDALGLTRNPYDRVVHFAGGFVGGLLVREALLRRTRLVRSWRTFFLVSLVCLAGGALYEILEWWLTVLARRNASQFLAMQGDQWDTQWDMVLALLGATLAQGWLGRLQDRQMRIRGLKREA